MDYRDYTIRVTEDSEFGKSLQTQIPETFGRLAEVNAAMRAIHLLFGEDFEIKRISTLTTVTDFEL